MLDTMKFSKCAKKYLKNSKSACTAKSLKTTPIEVEFFWKRLPFNLGYIKKMHIKQILSKLFALKH